MPGYPSVSFPFLLHPRRMSPSTPLCPHARTAERKRRPLPSRARGSAVRLAQLPATKWHQGTTPRLPSVATPSPSTFPIQVENRLCFSIPRRCLPSEPSLETTTNPLGCPMPSPRHRLVDLAARCLEPLPHVFPLVAQTREKARSCQPRHQPEPPPRPDTPRCNLPLTSPPLLEDSQAEHANAAMS